MIKVFNADDHPILRKGVTDLIVQTEGLSWAGSAANGKDALEKIRNIQPDVAVLDIEMPYLTGLEVARTLINEGNPTRFILLTLFKDEAFLHRAMDAGITGYLLKESSEKEITECIRFAYEGKPYVNPAMTRFLLSRNQNESVDVLGKLTKHEVNILKLIAREKTSSEIADMLFISPKTVSNHRTNISRKLQLDGKQNGLLKWALQHRELLQ